MMLRVFAVTLSLFFYAAPASAHLLLTSHEARDGSQIKNGPCGIEGSTRGTKIYTAKPGIGVNLVWKETVDHPGYYRIAFDDSGNDFVDPHQACVDTSDANACFNRNSAGPTGIDNIPDSPTPSDIYSQAYTLPNVACDNCTLQVIQVMTDKPPFVAVPGDDNDIYYQCLDLLLDPNGPDTLTLIGPSDDGVNGGGCQTGSGSAVLLVVVVLFALGYRRTHLA